MSLQPCYLAYTSPSAWLTPLGPRPLHIFLTQSSPSGVSSTYRISPSRPHTQTHRHPHTHTDTHVPPVAGGYLMGPSPSLFLTLSLPRSYHCPGHWGPIGQAEESGVTGSPGEGTPSFAGLRLQVPLPEIQPTKAAMRSCRCGWVWCWGYRSLSEPVGTIASDLTL